LHPPPIKPTPPRVVKYLFFYKIDVFTNFNIKYIKKTRTRLRNNPTPAEAFLWGYLKGSQLEGRKFRRQAGIKSFIVDFYCPAEKLVVELDGDFHFDDEGIRYDKERTKKIENEGINVIRFENQEVLLNLEHVLSEIKNKFKQ
jgi:very-short-patch-repair endonuclease